MRNRSFLSLIIAFVVGLLIGWFVFGWLIAPVKWSGGTLQDLEPAQKLAVIATTSEAFALTQDREAVVARLQALGTQEEVAEIASQMVATAESEGNLVAADRVRSMASAINLTLDVPEAAPPDAPADETPRDSQGGNSALLTVLGLLLIGGGIALAAWLLLRRRPSGDEEYDEASAPPVDGAAAATSRSGPAQAVAAPVATDPSKPVESGAVSQHFRAEYSQGDEDFDDSFDIEGSDGGYLGECGVTISEALNGDPSAPTALEVWLFDKSDIRTVTKVLMSDYAYGNSALREKLSARGDAVLLGPGLGFVLDAQSLRLAGRVVEMEYDGTAAPPSAVIRHLTLELRVIQQPPSA